MRAYKTVNDAYIEPISFTVPRRAETFQADIFPPAFGSRPAQSAQEWLNGKSDVPAKIDLESVYEGTALKEVESDYKPPPQSIPAPAAKPVPRAEEPRREEATPAASVRSPPPTMKEQKGSMSAMANKYQDNEDSEDNEEEDETSSFEEISRPTPRGSMPGRPEGSRPAATATRTAQAPAPAAVPVTTKTSPPHQYSMSTSTSTSTPRASIASSGVNVESSLDQIKQLIEQQTKLINTQNERIDRLASQVESIKRTVSSGSQDQSERIRQLELELEEARS